jgi:uncharacterized protein (TIGR03437 family)
MDPNPAYGRTVLDDYTAGFTANGQTVSGVVSGIAALVASLAQAGGFLVGANATVDIESSAGACGTSFQMGTTQFRYCGGAASLYEVDLTGPSYQGWLTDLGPQISRSGLTGSGSTAYKASYTGAFWTAGPLDVTIAAGGILNAASFTAAIAPGGLVSVFGAGFGRDPKSVAVDFGGTPAAVVAALPFQLNVQVPAGLAPGPATVHVSAGAGDAREDTTVSANAPALFVLAGGQGAVLNRDNSVNGPSNPARRGDYIVAFGTGFGTVASDGSLMRTQTPVTATLGGVNAPVLFSGLAPGFVGLYQINVSLPASMPPGLTLPFSVQQGNIASNTVQVAVQ